MEPIAYWRQQPAVRALQSVLLVVGLLMVAMALFFALHGGHNAPVPMIWPLLVLPAMMRPPLYALSGGVLAVLSPQGTRDTVPLAGAVLRRLSPTSLAVSWSGASYKRQVRVDADEAFTAAVVAAAASAAAETGTPGDIQMAVPPAPVWAWWLLGVVPVALAVTIWQHQTAYLAAIAVVATGVTLCIRQRRYVLAAGELLVVSQRSVEARISVADLTVSARSRTQVQLQTAHPSYPQLPVALAAGGRELVRAVESR